jgi:outer membrane protein assembly factor BamB
MNIKIFYFLLITIVLTNCKSKSQQNYKENRNPSLIVLHNNGKLASYNVQSKKQQWLFAFADSSNEKLDNRFTIDNGIIYAIGIKSDVVAIDGTNGKAIWHNTIDTLSEERRYYINGQIQPIDNGLTYFASFNKNLYAANIETGKIAWQYKLDMEFNLYPPVTNNTHVIVPSAGSVYCFEAQTGRAIWQRGFGSQPMYMLPQIDQTHAYVGGEEDIIYALNIENKANIDWQTKLPNNFGNVDQNTIKSFQSLLIGASNAQEKKGKILCLDTKDGTILWQVNCNINEKIKAIYELGDYVAVSTGDKTAPLAIVSKLSRTLEKVVQPKEVIISNFIRLADFKIGFLTKSYFVTYDLRLNTIEEQPINTGETDDADFNVHIEMLK